MYARQQDSGDHIFKKFLKYTLKVRCSLTTIFQDLYEHHVMIFHHYVLQQLANMVEHARKDGIVLYVTVQKLVTLGQRVEEVLFVFNLKISIRNSIYMQIIYKNSESATVSLNGSQHVSISLGPEHLTQTEELVLRFRTSRPLGLLLLTTAANAADRLELAVVAGRVRASVRLGDREKV